MAEQVSGDIARQAAAAPLPEKRGDAPKAKANPIAKLLGDPSFRLVGSPKWYDDKYDKSKQSMRLAFVDFNLSGLTITASIYKERKIEQRADGRYATNFVRFSLPKAVTVSKDDAQTTMHLETLKVAVLDSFEEWQSKVENQAGSKTGVSGSVRPAGQEKLD